MKFFKSPEAVMHLADLLYAAGYFQASSAIEFSAIIGGEPDECELDSQYINGLIKIFNSLESQEPGYIWVKRLARLCLPTRNTLRANLANS